jgi:asparagine synthase (glutamine-hydrolysing)
MSGLCGWFSHEPGALPISQMGAPLCRFDHFPLRVAEHGAGALALAAAPANGGIVHEDGLLVASWGVGAETLARLWRSHGADACAALAGSFAFAILDERRGEALLAVDRSASRPLFYQQVGRSLLFATSAEALVQHPGTGREIDPQALYDYLYFHGVPAPASVYKGQRRLLAGEFLHVQGGRLQRARYWKMQFYESQELSAPDLRQEFFDTVRGAAGDALNQQAAGVLLSGGQRSAAIAALLAGNGGARVRTYTVGYDGAAEDTLGRARSLARQLGTEHHERRIGAADAADAIPLLAAAFDQPLGDPSVLAAFHGAAMARADGVQRLLGGHGGAELFGARAHYARQARLSQYEKIPSALRQTLVEPLLFQLARGAGAAPLRRARNYIEQALVALPERLETDNLLHGYGGAEVLEPAFLARVDPTAPAGALIQNWWLAGDCCQVNQLIALDLKYALGDRQLPAAMRACEMAGVEAAFPFLGDAVVAFAARLSPHQKLDRVRLSPFLSESLRALLPHKAASAHSAAVPPFGHWLHSDRRLRGIAYDSLSDLKRRAIVKAGFIDTLLAEPAGEQPAGHARMVWLLMMLEQWLARRHTGAHTAPIFRRAEDESATCGR